MRFKATLEQMEAQHAMLLDQIETKRRELFVRMREPDCFKQHVDQRFDEIKAMFAAADALERKITKARKAAEKASQNV